MHFYLEYLPGALLLELVRDRLVWRGAAVRVVELALVAVGALLLVGAGRRQVCRAPALPEEIVQGGTVPPQRVVRRHEPRAGGEYYSVFRIHDILVWIRNRIWNPGSMPLTNGSGSAIFVTDLQDASKKQIFLHNFFCLLLFEGTFTLFFKDKKSKRVTK